MPVSILCQEMCCLSFDDVARRQSINIHPGFECFVSSLLLQRITVVLLALPRVKVVNPRAAVRSNFTCTLMNLCFVIIGQPQYPMMVRRRPQHVTSMLARRVLSSAISCRSSICPGRLSAAWLVSSSSLLAMCSPSGDARSPLVVFEAINVPCPVGFSHIGDSSSFAVPSGVMISHPCRTSYQYSPSCAIMCVLRDLLHASRHPVCDVTSVRHISSSTQWRPVALGGP